jgi:hypothetical protein
MKGKFQPCFHTNRPDSVDRATHNYRFTDVKQLFNKNLRGESV